jgi:hypothetical protein
VVVTSRAFFTTYLRATPLQVVTRQVAKTALAHVQSISHLTYLFVTYFLTLLVTARVPKLKPNVATPLWVKWKDETPTHKVGDLESFETPECLEFDRRYQNTSHWGVLDVIGKVLKCRCPKCPRIGHLNICSPSYGQKKGRESNWQFDSRTLKVGNRPFLDI